MLFRLLLAMAAGGVVGYGRSRKGRSAGFRTYMLISVGSALTVLLAVYDYEMLTTAWADIVDVVGFKFDASRYASQVMSGIGFLGAGTILATSHQQVRGLTTATGMFAAVGMGMAAGAGFYECVIVVLLLIVVGLEALYPVETGFKRRLRNITLYVEFGRIEDLERILDVVREREAQIYEIDVERTKREKEKLPGAILVLRLARHRASHSEMLSSIAELDCVNSIRELIS